MDESTRVQLCGAFAVELQGQRIDNMLPGRQGRLLFAYLALSRLQTVSRESLMEALWADDRPADAGGALSALISKTRAVVGETWRRRLADVRTRALEAYAKTCLELGGAELPGAVRAARELVEVAQFRESGHLLLMRALAARGNVAEALAAYERLRILLRDELGVDPSEAVQEAYVQLLG